MNKVKAFKIKLTPTSCQLYSSKVSAGFPSPADDFVDGELNLNDHLIQNKMATFVVKSTGESMKDVGIFPNDLLVVDRSITPKSGHIIIACIQSELLVKRLKMINNKCFLLAENKEFEPIEVKPDDELIIWGVVTRVIHSLV